MLQLYSGIEWATCDGKSDAYSNSRTINAFRKGVLLMELEFANRVSEICNLVSKIGVIEKDYILDTKTGYIKS